jgi:serine protease inhibitor
VLNTSSLLDRGSFADNSNEFALAMYSQLRRCPGNLFFSPFSIRTALGMACAGAKGETAAQMRDVLRFSTEHVGVHQASGRVIQRLNHGEAEVTLVNSLWAQDGSGLVSAFVDLIRRCYGDAVNAVDFVRAPEAARVCINEWVAQRTRDRIVNLIEESTLHADTRLILVSAVYCKGAWEIEFAADNTRDQPFYLENGGTSQVALMGYQKPIWHMQGNGYQAVDLKYRNSDLSMLVLLPDRRDGLRELEEALTVQLLNECTSQMEFTPVILSLPRFKFTWGNVDLSADLAALGMPLAFDQSRADFSGINGHELPSPKALFIAHVLHKAFVEVNEKGTEAAAATAVEMRRIGRALGSRPRPIPIFRADHPFLFALRDGGSGTILFVGRVEDPTVGS